MALADPEGIKDWLKTLSEEGFGYLYNACSLENPGLNLTYTVDDDSDVRPFAELVDEEAVRRYGPLVGYPVAKEAQG